VVLLYFANVWFGTSIGGLMDPEYQNAPWSLAKVGSVLAPSPRFSRKRCRDHPSRRSPTRQPPHRSHW
jgi:hypothetical protein